MVNSILLPESGTHRNVSPGFRRWLRMRDAAAERPTSHSAKLYDTRLTNAKAFTDYVQPRRHTKRWSGETDYWTCSDFCEALDAQRAWKREWSFGGLFTHLGAFGLTRDAKKHKCFVCNRTWKGDVVDDTNRVDFDTPHVYPPVLTTKKETKTMEPEQKFTLTPEHFQALNPSMFAAETPAPARSKKTFINTVDGYIFPQEPNVVGVTLTDEEFRIFRRLGMAQRSAYLQDRIARGV